MNFKIDIGDVNNLQALLDNKQDKLTTNVSNLFSIKSIRDFGASPINLDNSTQIQAAIDYCILNNVRVLFIPWGKYKITKSLIVMKPNGFCTLEILGESSFWDSNQGSEIVYTGTQGFALGIQNGKGCKVRKLTFTGLFKPPFLSDKKKFFNSTLAEFTDGICRDSRYSPHGAIMIDPFTNLTGQIPSDGGYPELKDKYGLYPNFSTQTGSTATEIEEIKISNFVIGIGASVNGLTRNAEISMFKKIRLENVKLGFTNAHDQEKENVIEGVYCWGGTHTIFANKYYGSSSPTWRMAGTFYISKVNIAGGVVQFVDWDGSGYFPTYISDVFAESLGRWGTFNSQLSCSIRDCIINFEYPDIAGVQTLISSSSTGVIYRDCTFRYYGNASKMYVNGNAKFDNCTFGSQVVNTVAPIQ